MKISLKSYKCFQKEITIDFGEKNALICGENGCGKSSVVDAFRWQFAQEGVKNHIPNFRLKEEDERTALLNDAKTKRNNKKLGTDFEIKFFDNDHQITDEELNDLTVFVISPEDTVARDSINIKKLVESTYLKIDGFDSVVEVMRADIQDYVNTALKECFMEEKIHIEIDTNYDCKIKDEGKNIEESENLTRYFNEARLRLINTLLLLSILIWETQYKSGCYIIFDDPITSLDSTNRTFLINYILDKFKKQHTYVFTHNIGFSYLWHYITEECVDKESKNEWKYLHLYEKGDNHYLAETRSKELKEIDNDFKNANNPSEYNDIGNDLRKFFESRLVMLSEQLQIGTKLETKNIIDCIGNRGCFYADQKKGAVDLIEQIEAEINKTNPHITYQNKVEAIQTAIDHYRIDAKPLKSVISKLKLYQKVVMHPMSHYEDGTTWSEREIRATITLLESLDSLIKNLKKLAPQQI